MYFGMLVLRVQCLVVSVATISFILFRFTESGWPSILAALVIGGLCFLITINWLSCHGGKEQ